MKKKGRSNPTRSNPAVPRQEGGGPHLIRGWVMRDGSVSLGGVPQAVQKEIERPEEMDWSLLNPQGYKIEIVVGKDLEDLIALYDLPPYNVGVPYKLYAAINPCEGELSDRYLFLGSPSNAFKSGGVAYVEIPTQKKKEHITTNNTKTSNPTRPIVHNFLPALIDADREREK